MTASRVLIELVIVLGTAAVITIAFQALRLPVVLGYVLAGLVIGPHVPVPFIADRELVAVLSELGVILLMFGIGLELRLSKLARVGVAAGLTAVFEVALVAAIGGAVARLVGLPADQALFAGAALGVASTMLVARTIEDRGWKGGFVDVVFAILVFEDLVAIVLLVILGGVASGAGLAAHDLAITLAKLAGFLVALLVGGLLVVPRLMRWLVPRVRSETLLVTALALCFGGAALAEHAGYSVALGAFVAGLLIAESGHGHDILGIIRPLRDVLAMVFFVSVGMTIAPGDLLADAPAIAALAAVVLVVKPLGVAFGVFLSGRGVPTAVRSGLALAQVGELSFVIGALASPRVLAIAVGVSCVTIIVSAVLAGRGAAIAEAIAARVPRRIATFESFYRAWLARLQATGDSRWRRPVRGLVLDGAALIALAITAVAVESYLALIALAVALPFAVGAVRRIVAIARLLAEVAVPPAVATVDLGRAPRRALALTIELALALALAAPLVAIVQPVVATGVVVALGALAVIVYRSIVDFDQHVRAGSELVLELLARSTAPDVEAILPGFAGASLRLAATSPAVGRSLAELDLRAKTGATVLAIARGDHGVATPAPSEPLQANDVLALAGSAEAVAAARALLDPS